MGHYEIFLIFLLAWSGIAGAQQPKVFLEELLSDKVEYSVTVTPDKTTVYFVKTDSFYVSKPKNIYKSTKVAGKWSKPTVASFSGTGSDSSPFVSPDGKKLFFTSHRDGDGSKANVANIWYVNLVNGSERKPIYITAVNSGKSEYSPTVDNEGNLYFGSYRDGGFGSGDIWKSKFENGQYQKPINLGANINTEYGEWGSCIAPDGSYLIFENSGRKENLSEAGDLYISYFENNIWLPAIHLDVPINSKGSDLTPKIHGDILYFASNRNSMTNSSRNNVDLYYLPME